MDFVLLFGPTKRTIQILVLAITNTTIILISAEMITQCKNKLDPVGSTVRYEVVELCTGTLWDNNGCYLAVLSQYEALIATVCV